MQSFTVHIFNDTAGYTYSGAFTCRDVARVHIMARADLAYTSRINVYFANISAEITERICDHLRRVPQYAAMRFAPVQTKGTFNQDVYGISLSGNELYHAFYWAALLMRASITYPNWKTVTGLLRSITPNEGVHWGLKTQHIDAWRRVVENRDVTSAQMLRTSLGPLSTYSMLPLRRGV